jgi:hypothetical protein
MTIIVLVRLAIWLTFLLLVVEGIAAIVWATRFSKNYVLKHRELEVRVEGLERRMRLPEEHP